ncbi:hypothetical protein ACFFNY_00010 [Paenibacillus hodogayensis]|uniref:GNAT family N-acetyltransferase n=1 Tax=Paenibacillus hodogayensis TaxID=279208 RepID=A0ABV5VNT6_9BACL
MTTLCKRCSTDEDFAKISLFILDRRHDLHPSFTTLDTVGLLYGYINQGHSILVEDDEGRVVGATAFYHGTPDREFEDKEVAFVDLAIMDKAYRGTRLFLQGLRFLVSEIAASLTEVEEIRFVALSENAKLCRLYAKITEFSYVREGKLGNETVFCVKLNKIKAILRKFDKV